MDAMQRLAQESRATDPAALREALDLLHSLARHTDDESAALAPTVAMLATGRYAPVVAVRRALRAAEADRKRREGREVPVESETLATLAEAARADDRAEEEESARAMHETAMAALQPTQAAILAAIVKQAEASPAGSPERLTLAGVPHRLRLKSRTVANVMGRTGTLNRAGWESVRRTACGAFAAYSQAIGGYGTQDVSKATDKAYNYVTTTNRMGTGAPLLARTKTQAKGRIHHRMGERTSIPVYPVTITRNDGTTHVVMPERATTRAGLQGRPFTAPTAGEMLAMGPTGAYGTVPGVGGPTARDWVEEAEAAAMRQDSGAEETERDYSAPVGAGQTHTLGNISYLASKGAKSRNRAERKDESVYAVKAIQADALCRLYAEEGSNRVCACGIDSGSTLVEVKRTRERSDGSTRALPSHWAHPTMVDHALKH